MPNRSSKPVPDIPAAPQLERAVLGAVLLKPECLYEIYDRLSERSFYGRENRVVWTAMLSLFNEDKPIDVATVAKQLEQTGDLVALGGRGTLIDIADSVLSVASTPEHAKMLLEYERKRALRESALALLENISEPSADLMQQLETDITTIRAVGAGGTPALDQQVLDAIDANLRVVNGNVPSHAWSFRSLTRATKGLQPGKVYVVIALYKTGKSKLLTATLQDLTVRQHIPCLFFSMEMRPTQILNWMAGNALQVDTSVYGTSRLSKDDIKRTNNWLQQHIASPGYLHINDRSVQTPESICAEMRRAKMQHGVEVACIDFLQRIVFGERGQVQEIERGMNLIASTARDLDVAVIALSQVPKSAENKGRGETLHMGDVKSSGAIAEAADCCIAMTDPNRHRDSPDPERMLKFVVEGRDIPTSVLDVRADLRYGHFHEVINMEPIDALN